MPQPRALGENNNSAVVIYLMEHIPQASYIIYLDNLFTNIKLLQYMRERGVGITGTCTAKSGILKKFIEIKAKDTKKDEILWGTLYHEPSANSQILFIAWKDNALVLFMTTIKGGLDIIESLRKRPSETSTSAKTARVPFGDQPTAVLEIPAFDDKYNHNISAINKGNKLKAIYNMQYYHRRGGHHSIITWLLETALVNTYLLSFHSLMEDHLKYTIHSSFNQSIINKCFEISRSSRKKRRASSSLLDLADLSRPIEDHSLIYRSHKGECVVCKRESIPRKKRKVLGEISANSKGSGCRKSSIYGCSICEIPLCKDSTCFDRFHSPEW
jgi:Transposase IS4